MRTLQTVAREGSRLAIALISVFAMNGCGIGVESTDETKAQEVRDAKAIEDRYNQVKGVYVGTISNPATGLKPLASRLSLYLVYVQAGNHADGTPRMRPELRGSFRLLDAITETDNLTLAGNFSEFGELKMTTMTSGGSGAGTTLQQLSLSGRIDGGNASVHISRAKGLWGTFEGQLRSDSTAPAGGEDEEYRQRLLEIYKKVGGTYEGVVRTYRTVGGEAVEVERYPVEVKVIVVENPAGDGVSLPKMIAHFRRLDMIDGIGERSLSVEYNSLTNDIVFRNSGSGGGTPGYEVFSITARVNNRSVNGTLVDKFGDHVIEMTKR